jgi:hypothetical protein
VFSFFFLCFVTGVTPANTTLSPIILPAPPGPYVTKFKIQVMVDTSRPDPYNSSEKSRRLVTSVFTPVLKSDCSNICDAQYMPPATAAVEDKGIGATEPLFERFKLSGICCNASTPRYGQTSTEDTYTPPLIIWFPGFSLSRLLYSATAQYIASYGYEVITVDQPGDAGITEFPDGEIVSGVYGGNITAEERVVALNIETEDVLFVIDSYSKGTNGASRIYGTEKKVGIIAHGAVAAQAMLNDSLNGNPGRIAGGVNLDGRYEGPVLTDGMGAGKKSSLLWVPPSGPEIPATWDEWWNITGKLDHGDWQKELCIANSTQGSYSDLPLLADISGFRKVGPTGVNATIGTINGVRLTSILTTYTTAFFDMALKGEKEPLLSGPSNDYPEVSFVRSST